MVQTLQKLSSKFGNKIEKKRENTYNQKYADGCQFLVKSEDYDL